ncbi:MAG: aminoglycoside 6-adenylyltransferase [Clostridia bacterium]|nr:aminoglycoside 6-adenylyltransferase [Clostridia bacterium]
MEVDLGEFYRNFEDRFIKWAQSSEDMKAAFVVGSRARKENAADEWSDLDIIIYTTNPQYYLEESDWLNSLGELLCTFVYKTSAGEPERLTLFNGGYQVDFVVHFYSELLDMVHAKIVPQNFYRGVRMIVDKESGASDIVPGADNKPRKKVINEEMFAQIVNMFWFISLYIAKQLLRGELWAAKDREADSRQLLLQMIEWHAVAKNGEDYDTWHAGRFINEWADKSILAELKNAYGHYDYTDSRHALSAAMALFSRLSHEVADRYGYRYPQNVENSIVDWINMHK